MFLTIIFDMIDLKKGSNFMHAKGKVTLKTSATIILLFGILEIFITTWSLIQHSSNNILGFELAKSSTGILMLVFLTASLHIIGGIIGILFADKPQKANICFFLGLCFILIAGSSTLGMKFTTKEMYTALISILVPVFYTAGALQNKQSYELSQLEKEARKKIEKSTKKK